MMSANSVRRLNRFVLDTNVLVRATMYGAGPSGRLFDQLMFDNSKIALVCQESLAELRRVFGYNQIASQVSEARREMQLQLIERLSEVVEISGLRQAVPDDPDDNVFVELAEIGRADCLVSLDRHLLALRPVGAEMAQTWQDVEFASEAGPLPIMRPTELLKAFELGEAI